MRAAGTRDFAKFTYDVTVGNTLFPVESGYAWVRRNQVTRKKLEEEAVGGLHLEVMGVVWLFAGTVLATAPNEILKLF